MDGDERAITTVISAAANFALSDLTTTRSELSIKQEETKHDVWLGRAISQVSRTIANVCNRDFPPQQYSDEFWTRGRATTAIHDYEPLILARSPLISVLSVVEDSGTPLVAGTDFEIDAGHSFLYRLDGNGLRTGWWAKKIVVGYIAGFGAVVSQATTIPGDTFKIAVDSATAFAIDQGVIFTGGAALSPITNGTPAAGQYLVNSKPGADLGKYLFAAADVGKDVTISYGFNQFPDDLVDATLRAVVQRFKGRERDPMMMSFNQPGLGETRFLVGGGPNAKGPFTPDIMALLDPYRVPTVG